MNGGERDPRVMAVAERLAEAQPYGARVRNGWPSAADYHAAIIAVQTLDGLKQGTVKHRERHYVCLHCLTGITDAAGTLPRDMKCSGCGSTTLEMVEDVDEMYRTIEGMREKGWRVVWQG